ncbi:hypothetical protein PVAND_005488 [Polypedilum vanderplanki]|uniref:Uncharacterized protein n=1 Tax=Polypedilum vanderplanki TaxID=319348 RepID=A0A9J6C1B2_POLVA|nr:hypothetical protein PVAND_005488 [Polypedilum vanderplanki]
MKTLIIFCCFIAVISSKVIDKLPSSLEICNLNDPKRDECIKNSMEHFLTALHEKPDTLDFPTLEPFIYDKVTFRYNNPDFVNGWFTIRNQKTYGTSRVKILKVKSEFTEDEMKLNAVVNFPKLFSTGNYKSNITLGVFKMESKGQFNITMLDVTAKWTLLGKIENGFMNIHQFDVLPEAAKMNMSATGLFPDEELNKFANDFFNEHWQLFYREMIPETRKQWEPIFRETKYISITYHKRHPVIKGFNVLVLYMVPAFLYCLYNNLSFYNLSVFDPTTYYLLLQFRVVITGVLFQIIFKKYLSRRQWISLLLLTLGCMIKQIDFGDKEISTTVNSEANRVKNTSGFDLSINAVFIIIQTICSCLAGVYNEYLLKNKGEDINIYIQNVFMYIDSIICNALILLVQGNILGAFKSENLYEILQPGVIIIMINSCAIGITLLSQISQLNFKDFCRCS